MGSRDAVEGGTLLGVDLTNTLVVQLPQLVMVVPDHLLDDLVRQVSRGRVERGQKVVVRNVGA